MATSCRLGLAIDRNDRILLPMRLFFLVIALLSAAAVWANPFPGGHELLGQVATQWISTETGSPIAAINIKLPDKRIPIKPCDREIRVRFPFINNNKTIGFLPRASLEEIFKSQLRATKHRMGFHQ